MYFMSMWGKMRSIELAGDIFSDPETVPAALPLSEVSGSDF
jgi:hypothetical protein